MNHQAAQLYIGQQTTTQQTVLERIKKQVCSCICAISKAIDHKTYYHLLWVEPSKQWYTISDLEKVMHAVNYRYDQPFFIVITDVDKLSQVCANSLLKTLEEPHENIFFYLTAQSQEVILPTIISRSVVHIIDAGKTSAHAVLLEQIQKAQQLSLTQFARILEESTPAESDSKILLDHLIEQYHCSSLAQKDEIINFLLVMRERTPMPGSVKFFWRTVFLGIKQLHS
ncbi:MAG: hypothetical protein M1114_00860 [Candidatus Dependentiae bacterium]|nr:hypothetical protein [Candidatus Dependentiae bacterium]